MTGIIRNLIAHAKGTPRDQKRSKAVAANVARANPVLGRLSRLALARLIRYGEPVAISSGGVLIRQGEPSDCAYLVLEGDFSVCAETKFGDVPLAHLSPGALIGEIGVFADLPRTASIRAESNGCVLRLDRTGLLRAGDTDPALLRSVVGRLGAQIGSFNQAIGLYTNALSALERADFDPGILDQLRQPVPELVDFAQSFRRMAEQIVRQRNQWAEMASAAAIQRAMLPSELPPSLLASRFDLHARMMPAREVGGDLYDFFPVGENRLAITVGDVSGKGVPAALFMAVTQTVMRLVLRSGKELGAAIATANDLLVATNEQMMFTTFFCGILDLASGVMTFCNCGHNPPLLMRHDEGALQELQVHGPPVGIEKGMDYATETIAVEPGDILFLYSDGVTEAEDSKRAQFGSERLEQAVREKRAPSAHDLVEHVMARVADFTSGAPQSDDITCIALLMR